jgi:uncharacterized protein (DUF885 family)
MYRAACRALSLALLAAWSLSAAHAQSPSSEARSTLPAVRNAAEARLRALYTAEFEWAQAEAGYERGGDGRWQPGARLPSVTPQAWQRRIDYWRKALAELDQIPEAELSAEEQINAAVFRAATQASLNNALWRSYEAPLNSDTYFWGYLAPLQPHRTAEDWQRLLGRMADIPRFFAEHQANMEHGLARGWSVPRASLAGRDATLEPYTFTDARNPFLAAFERIPPSVPEAERQRLQEHGRRLTLDVLVPAYRQLLDYMRNRYLPNTRTTTSVADLPDGAAFYQSQIREYVTLDMTAAQIHQLGLAEVERISADMRQVMHKAGFDGSFEQFLEHLRTDPQFYARSPHELIAEASFIAKRIDGELNHVLGTLPRFRFTIVEVPADIAPTYTSGRGGLEACMFNTYDLASRPLYNLPALTLHECAPGHSLQAALALEAPQRPEFRQQVYFSGYGEGWGLYTEWLGIQMGIYQTPYQEFGRLTFEMWRAARLVIDTGLHAYGWSREQAIEYLSRHTALARADIVNEVDRYISWPGQALSYYIGYKTLLDLRREAEQALGDAFDQRAFHDTVLGLGGVPLPVLKDEVRAFIRRHEGAQSPSPR